MLPRTFEGGIHVLDYKELTEDLPITKIPLPQEVVIPLRQHTGAPCSPAVKVGERVKTGQLIGLSNGFVSALVHSSVDGVVTAIEQRPYFTGSSLESVVIAVDEKQQPVDWPKRDITHLTADEMRDCIREAGIVGMGGAAFPTHVKLSPPEAVDSVIINACECEPFLTCDHRMMLEMTDRLIEGARIIGRIVGARKVYFGIEDNKANAIQVLKEKTDNDKYFKVVPLKVKYPQGSEKQLIKAILNREVPLGKLPFNVGVVMQNVGTAIACYDAVKYQKPLIERVVTVTGDGILHPGNVLVRIGTPLRHVIEHRGGLVGINSGDEVTGNETRAEVRYPTYRAPRVVEKVIVGGPMTGFAQSTLDVSVVKGTTGILVFTSAMIVDNTYMDCVRCGRCVDHCPMRLYPNHIGTYSETGRHNMAVKWGALDCFECGVCAYVCPSKRPIVHFVRQTKEAIAEQRRKAPKSIS